MERTLVVIGLASGALFGFAGGIAGSAPIRPLLYAVSSAGLIVGCLFAATWWYERGARTRAAGFACLALAEAVMHSGTGGVATETAFAGGALLYVPALLLIAAEAGLAVFTRAVSALAAVPFGIHAVAYYVGTDVSYAGPVAVSGYAVLAFAFIGWIVAMFRTSFPYRATREVAA